MELLTGKPFCLHRALSSCSFCTSISKFIDELFCEIAPGRGKEEQKNRMQLMYLDMYEWNCEKENAAKCEHMKYAYDIIRVDAEENFNKTNNQFFGFKEIALASDGQIPF
jgi:hypothetical protein